MSGACAEGLQVFQQQCVEARRSFQHEEVAAVVEQSRVKSASDLRMRAASVGSRSELMANTGT